MNKQRGEGRLGCILYILVIVYILIIGVQIVPVLYNNLQMKDEMGQVASSYYQFRGNQQRIYMVLTDKARALDIPLGRKDFKIIKRAKRVDISAHYGVEINFLFMKKEIKLNPKVSKPAYNF